MASGTGDHRTKATCSHWKGALRTPSDCAAPDRIARAFIARCRDLPLQLCLLARFARRARWPAAGAVRAHTLGQFDAATRNVQATRAAAFPRGERVRTAVGDIGRYQPTFKPAV